MNNCILQVVNNYKEIMNVPITDYEDYLEVKKHPRHLNKMAKLEAKKIAEAKKWDDIDKYLTPSYSLMTLK